MTSRSALHRELPRAAVALALGSAFVPGRASAEEQIELAWEAPPECPQEAAVRQKLRSLAGEAWHTTERVSAKGRIERVDGRYRLTLTVRDGTAVKERTIDSESCIDLGGAGAVTLGLLLGRGPGSADAAGASGASASAAAGAQGSGTTGTENSAKESASSTTAAGDEKGGGAKKASVPNDGGEEDDAASDDDEAPIGSRSGSARRFHPLLRAPQLTLDVVRLPKPSIGFGAGLGARYAEWRLVASGRMLLDQTSWSEEFPDVGSRVSRLAAELDVCRGVRSGSLELSPCVTVGLEHVTARGTGPSNMTPQSQRSTSALFGAAGVAHLHLTDWMAVCASLGVSVATSSPRLTVAGLGEVGHLRPVQVSAGIGPEWIF